jgi:uncharacterized protein (DUF1501 family)
VTDDDSPVDGPADLARLGPNPAEAALRGRAARVRAARVTRRRFLAGGAAGAAALGTQLATTRVSFGAGSDSGTLVVIFLRGGVDGLSVVVPADDPHLLDARPDIALRGGALLPLDRGFGLHPALAPVHELWRQGRFTAVPAVSTPDISRSHFQAQDCLERGGSDTGTTEGWLDRVLDRLGPGTTFRSVSRSSTVPRSLAGDQPSLSLRSVESFALAGWEGVHDKTIAALTTLYTGLDHPLGSAVATTLEALDTAGRLNATSYRAAATYPEGDLGEGLAEVARLIKGDVGLRVAAVDVGGWDMHARIGTVDEGGMKDALTGFGEAMGAFATDLGDRLDDVTVVAVTEFGRRVSQNASNGTDHGHGAVVMLLGGRLAGGTVHGNWQGLAPDVLDQGDVPGSNDYRNVLGEAVSVRLGLTSSDLGTVFPGHRYQPLGVMR